MAISAGTLFETNASATAGNLNSGGFNPNNANFLADGAATSATGNSPVFTSASYNFVAGDVGHWVYIKSGTNWTPGWYKIASVATGAATLTGNIGSAVQYNAVNNEPAPSTIVGCATTASPTSATWGIDYSQSTTARYTATDLTGATTSCTSATNPFSTQMVGNLIHLTAGTGVTAGWYEIVSVSVVTATLDRSAGTTYSAVTYYTGGALSLGAASDGTATSIGTTTTNLLQTRWYYKSGAYTPGATINITAGSTSGKTVAEGYYQIRGDKPSINSGNQPTFTSTFTFSMGNNSLLKNVTTISSNSAVITGGTSNIFIECRVLNNSTSNRFGINAVANTSILGCDLQSYRGPAVINTASGSLFLDGCYIHDSLFGINASSTTSLVCVNNIFAGSVTSAIVDNASCQTYLFNNTFYGAENIFGIAYQKSSNAIPMFAYGNIFYGFTTAITQTTGASTASRLDYNDFFNNTNNVTSVANVPIGFNDLFVSPQFTSVAQVTFTNGTTSGSVLTSSGANFSNVVDGKDFLYLVSGTGITVGVYGIVSHTTTTLTLDIAPGTNATADKVGQVTTGRNFGVGTNLRATGFPGGYPNTNTMNYLDTGAAQRQESSSSGGSFTFS